MQKIIAAFIAPSIVFIWFSLYTSLVYKGFSLDTLFVLFNDFLSAILLVYLYALPAYILIGVPISLLIERLNKGIRWINYCLAGVVGGFIVLLIYPGSSLDNFTTVFIFYMLAGLSFYIALKWVETKDKKIRKSNISYFN